MWRGAKIGIVVPAFNEARLIRKTVSSLPDYADRIVVVDDASTDGTWAELQGVASPRLVCIRHRYNRGVGAAIVSGYLHCLREELDVLAVMAGDNQMRPDELPELLRAVLVDGVDYAKGNRLLHPNWRRMPRARRWGSRLLSALTRLSTGLRVGDAQCGYTALSARAARRLPLALLWPRYGYPNDLLALLAAQGASVRDVPVSAVYADERSGLHAGHVLSIGYRIFRRAVWLRKARADQPKSDRSWPD
jgi:glycosyltransferase involved in cell wall biosynthesis